MRSYWIGGRFIILIETLICSRWQIECLAAQQDTEYPEGACWDHYFPFNATNVRADEKYLTSFIALMRYSFHRPRDILTILDTLREKYDDPTGQRVFEYKDLFTSDFKRTYGDYLLGELKDSLSFYYDEKEFELFMKFFEFLDGRQKLTYEQYIDAFNSFTNFLAKQREPTPGFMKSAEEFLQFLYDQNILSYVEHTEDNERFIRWCFIERTPSNISPKVKTELEYEIHYGLANVLNTGKELKRKRRNVLLNVEESKLGQDGKLTGQTSSDETQSPSAFSIGIVKFYDRKKQFGFIKHEGEPREIYFSAGSLLGPRTIRKGAKVKFVLGKDSNGRVVATKVRAAR